MLRVLTFIAITLFFSAPLYAEENSVEANSGFGDTLFSTQTHPGFLDPDQARAQELSVIEPAAGDEETPKSEAEEEVQADPTEEQKQSYTDL